MDIRKAAILLLYAGVAATTAAPVRADTRDDVLGGIQRCGAIRDDRTWLNCVYGAQQPMRAQLGLPAAPEFQLRLVPPPQTAVAPPPVRPVARPAPRRKAGFFETLVGNTPPVTTARMASYSYDRSGAFVVTLENGQEWRQTDAGGGTASWLKPPSAYLVTIIQGAFGSYSLHTDDNTHSYKVERVK